jgi:hypothetical protein
MIYTSKDSLLQVSVSEKPDPGGYFTVFAKQLTDDKILANIKVDFGGEQPNFTTLVYRTGDQTKGMFTPVKGSHPGDTVQDVIITIELVSSS